MVVAESLGIKSRRMDTYLKELTGTKKIKKVTHGTYEKSTPATLQYVQFDPEGEEFQQDEPQTSLGHDQLNDKMEAIESEFPQSDFSDYDIAQIAILHTPFSEESEEVGNGDIFEIEPEFKWLTNVFGCTYYDQDELQNVLKASGYHSHMERLTQIHLAVRFNKLEEIEGNYMLNRPCH